MDHHAHDHEHQHPLLKFFDFAIDRSALNVERSKRLQSMARNAKIPGFRPGKTPMSIIEKRFGEGVTAEVIDELAKQLVQEKMNKENLNQKLASRVSFHPNGENDESLLFHAHYEVFPEFELALNKVAAVKKPKVNIDDKAVDEMIDWMCRIYGDDTEADSIEKTDRVTMAFEMLASDGSNTSLLKIDPYQFVVPLHKPENYIDFPAQALLGKKVGDTVEWSHQYPEDFANPLVAGQKINLKATIQSVVRKESLTAEVLIERLGLKDKTSDEQRAEIRKQVEAQVNRRIDSTFATRLGRALRMAHDDIDVPPTMQNAELHQQGERLRADIHALQHAEGEREKALMAKLETEAKQQLQTQIIWLKVSENITDAVKPDEVMAELRRQSEEFEDADAVFTQLVQDRNSTQRAYEIVQQKKMMDWLLPQIQVEDEEVSFADFMIG